MMLFWKLTKKLFCNWALIVKILNLLATKKISWKYFKPFTNIGLHIFVYYFKCKLKKNKKTNKNNSKNKIILFIWINENLSTTNKDTFLAYSSFPPFPSHSLVFLKSF